MTTQSRMHFYVNWAKARLDEMDAALACIETKADQVREDSKKNAQNLMAELKRRRDEYEATLKAQVEAGEEAWGRTKAQLETQAKAFDADVKTYMETVAKQAEQQQATFRQIAAAQLKAWGEAAENIQQQTQRLAAERRAEVDAAVRHMQAEAGEAEKRVHNIGQAPSESGAALTAALTDSRNAFERAHQAAADAFRRAESPKGPQSAPERKAN